MFSENRRDGQFHKLLEDMSYILMGTGDVAQLYYMCLACLTP